MKLSQRELELIRKERIGLYNKELTEHLNAYDSYRFKEIFLNKLIKLGNDILEVDSQLNKLYPKWDDIPF